MAIVITNVFDGLHVKVFEVTMTADADTVAFINHGLASITGDNVFAWITTMQQAVGELSAWAVINANDTDVQVEKSIAVGSGDAAPQLRVTVFVTEAPVFG